MKLDPEDHERYINMELNLDELNVLGDLLRVETIYQIKKQVGLASGSVEDRSASIINTFGVFQDFDTQIKELQASFGEFQKTVAHMEVKPINMVVLSKNRIKIYHFLCTKTTELVLPSNLSQKCKELIPSLLIKLEEALAAPPILDSMTDGEIDLGIKVNMLGQRGIA